MSCKKLTRVFFLFFLILFLGNIVTYSQKDEKCSVKKDNSIPRFKIGSFERGKNPSFILRISLDSADINPTNLISVTTYLRKQYCKEREIIVGIFDDDKAAKNFTFNKNSVYFEKSLESSRGEYYFNRDTKEEFIEYTMLSGYLKRESSSKRIKIYINKDKSTVQNKTSP